ncbi:uncharacterized membrane protein YhaH (DUF805 family) [Chryseobacterium sp. H1D6B]|uniref:hypothetical protein n=1 Tax=Chryseobacterium sp. H1D6B TaxID=2940588 RepID=UPI0015CE1B40|nr:hypothetical protein [Chryseobacterium sp. H1D6B]MDH6253421.1 uncharacterized membrane protein YhaH (DUF805 family) [Chryseobacterium sp. H1D6B]
MRTSFLTAITNASTFVGSTQNDSIPIIDKDIQVMIGIIISISLIAFTILGIIKRWMDYRLKNKLIDNGLSENIIKAILEDGTTRNKNSTIKWSILLAAVGIALTIINYTLPLGIHSVAIMTFCVSASFLIYYFFLKYTDKQNN